MEYLKKEEKGLLLDFYKKSSISKWNADIEETLNIIYEQKGGYVLVEKENGDIKHFMIALDMHSLKREDRIKALYGMYPTTFKRQVLEKERKYLQREIIWNCLTTFMILTDYQDGLDFYNNEFTRALLQSHLNYNLIFIQPTEVDEELFAEVNDAHVYSHGGEEFPYNILEKYEREDFSYLRICRFPELLKIYDDARIEAVPMILPIDFDLEGLEYQEIELKGFMANPGQPYFISKIGNVMKARFYKEVPFDVYYRLEHSLNLFEVNTGIKIKDVDDELYQCVLLYANKPSEFKLFSTNVYEALLSEKDIPTGEKKLISDIYTVIPARYESIERIYKYHEEDNNFIANNIITGLIFQENFEYGVDESNDRRFKERIRRIDLGTIHLMLLEETHYNYFDKTQIECIAEEPIPVRLIATLDLDTHTAALYMVYMGFNDRASKYLDQITRNEIFVAVPENEYGQHEGHMRIITTEAGTKYKTVCLHDYIYCKYQIEKLGLPRNLVISPFISDEQNDIETHKSYISSILYGETSFAEEEELGKIVDDSIDDLLAREYGDNIYDYAKFYISRVTVLQCEETYKDYVVERIDFAVVELFYIELVCLELAAIYNASSNISKFINNYNIQTSLAKRIKEKFTASSEGVLGKIDEILEEYARTLDFWDVPMNYHSSKKALDIIRDKFEVEREVGQLERNRSEISSIYESRKAKNSALSNYIMSLIGVMLTLSSVIGLFSGASGDEQAKDFEEIIYNFFDELLMIRIVFIVAGVLLFFKGIKALIFKEIERHEKKIR